MGLIAYSGTALLAAFAIHSFLSRNGASRTSTTSADRRDSRDITDETIVQDHVSSKQPSLGLVTTTTDDTPPIVVVEEEEEEEEDFPLRLEHVRTAPERPIQPSKLMPPPPLPRRQSHSPPRLNPPTFGLMPAPPRPANGSVRPPPSTASSLRVPQTKVLSNTSMAPSLGVSRNHVSKQAHLQPGFSPLDWAALTSNPKNDLRGKDAPINFAKVTPSQLKLQDGRRGRDAWTSFQGKVYNVTPYVPFHPGGKGEIMRGAGKDCTKLFMETHSWVNIDMLRECLVGIMVAEDESVNLSSNNPLDEMD